MKVMIAVAAASLLFLAGCSSSSPGAAASPAASAAGPSRAPGPVGGACELPVAFEVAEGWESKAIDLDQVDDTLLAGMFRTGPFETICSVNGKPAGVDGFVRVYFSDVSAGSPRDNLKVFVLADTVGPRGTVDYETRDAEYSAVTVGGQPAAEVTWNRYSKAKKSTNKYSAFSLDTPRGTFVVVLVPFTAGEYDEVRPAYELVRKTLTVNP